MALHSDHDRDPRASVPSVSDGKLMEPVMACGLKSNSIGYLVAEQDATIWRGPMAKARRSGRSCMRTRWGEVDYLVVDMPPAPVTSS